MAVRDQGALQIWKPCRNCAPGSSTANHEDSHAPAEQFTVDRVRLHELPLLIALNKLPQRLLGIGQELSRERAFSLG
jgi:hypothetical protein